MIVRRDYETNLSNHLELMLQSFSHLVISHIMEDYVMRHNAFAISYPWPVMLVIKFARMNPILTTYNVVLVYVSHVTLR